MASPPSSKIRRASAPLLHAVDVQPFPFTSHERSRSAPGLSSYFQSLFQSLHCPRPYSISIVPDNHATHSSASLINSSMPPLPTLDEHDPLSKPAEKLLIIFGNASAYISEPAVITHLSNGHQDATNTTLLADPLTKESEIIQLEEEVEESDYYIDITFHDELKKMDSPSRLRHERSNSMDHSCSPCTSKSS
jgi:hypothetical protein